MFGQLGLGLCVLQLMGNVSEKGAARLDTGNPLEGLLHGVVAGVMLPAQRIDDEHVEVFQQRQTRFGDYVHVGEVGGGAEAVSGDCEISVEQGHTLEAHAPDCG